MGYSEAARDRVVLDNRFEHPAITKRLAVAATTHLRQGFAGRVCGDRTDLGETTINIDKTTCHTCLELVVRFGIEAEKRIIELDTSE